MDIILELMYDEIENIAESLSYFRGKCDSIFELCATYKYIIKDKKDSNLEEFQKIETLVKEISNELNMFTRKTQKITQIKINEYKLKFKQND